MLLFAVIIDILCWNIIEHQPDKATVWNVILVSKWFTQLITIHNYEKIKFFKLRFC